MRYVRTFALSVHHSCGALALSRRSVHYRRIDHTMIAPSTTTAKAMISLRVGVTIRTPPNLPNLTTITMDLHHSLYLLFACNCGILKA